MIVYSYKLIDKDFQFSSVYIIVSRCLLIVVGCIIGVNLGARRLKSN